MRLYFEKNFQLRWGDMQPCPPGYATVLMSYRKWRRRPWTSRVLSLVCISVNLKDVPVITYALHTMDAYTVQVFCSLSFLCSNDLILPVKHKIKNPAFTIELGSPQNLIDLSIKHASLVHLSKKFHRYPFIAFWDILHTQTPLRYTITLSPRRR